MATLEECRLALHDLAERLAAHDGDRRPPALDRSLSCRLTDLDAGLHGRLTGRSLTGIAVGEDRKAQITIALSSDDLLTLTRGELNFASAWASGRIKVNASVFDLLKLRSLL